MLTNSQSAPEAIVDPAIGSSICCFTGETLVTINDSVSFHIASMFDEREKFSGTEIKSFDNDGNISVDFVVDIVRYRIDWYFKVTFEDGAWLNVTAGQRFFSEGRGFEPIAKLGEGARVLRHRQGNWNWLAVVSIEEINDARGLFVYGLTTLLTGNFFVEDLGVCGPEMNAAQV